MTESTGNIKEQKNVWVVTEGIAGTENQCIGIAESLGYGFVRKRIALRQPWKALTPYLLTGSRYALSHKGDKIAPPYPDIAICAGRKAIPAALKIKQESGGQTFVVFLQHPRCDLSHFDKVIMPAHDWVSPQKPANLLLTNGALNRITPEILGLHARDQAMRFAYLPPKKLAFLIGGNSKTHQFGLKDAHAIVDTILELRNRYADMGILVTASRRTGPANFDILKRALLGQDRLFFWDGETQPNPYFAFMGMADWIITTNDSISMMSEAFTSGKPTYLWPLEGGSVKFDRFYKAAYEKGCARLFEGKLESFSYEPWNDTEMAAKEIKKQAVK